MVHFPQVHDLVRQNVIPDVRWRLDEPPIQENGPARRAGAPTRSLVPHRNPTHRQSVQCREFENSWRQLFRGQSPQMSLNRRTQINRCVGHFYLLYAKPYRAALPIHSRLNLHRVAAKKNLGPDEPLLWPLRTRGQPLQLPLKPFPVALRKTSSLDRRAAARNGHTRRTVRTEPKHVTARTRIANESHGNPAPANAQKFLCRETSRRVPGELELHASSKRRLAGAPGACPEIFLVRRHGHGHHLISS